LLSMALRSMPHAVSRSAIPCRWTLVAIRMHAPPAPSAPPTCSLTLSRNSASCS
jgi:hypothetical protein